VPSIALNREVVVHDERPERSRVETDMFRSRPYAAIVLAFVSFLAVPSAHAQQKGNTWSGYILKGPQDPFAEAPLTTFSYVSATWTQPSVVCTTPNAEVSIWVGLDGNGTPTVEQTGTIAVCGSAAAPLYYKAWWEMYAPDSNSTGQMLFDVSPGDVIEASVTYTNGTFVLAITDKTTGKSSTTTHTCDAAVICYRGTAEWIIERPGSGKYPLADYGKAGFSKLAVQSAGPSPTTIEMDMVDKSNNNTLLSTCNLVTISQTFIACSWVAAQ
jgi:Peptidase A4 family